MEPTPVFLPGEFHGQQGQAGYSAWASEESDMTEETEHTKLRQATRKRHFVCSGQLMEYLRKPAFHAVRISLLSTQLQ